MKIGKEYRRCKRAWNKLARKDFVIKDDKHRVLFARLISDDLFLPTHESVTYTCDYIDLDNVYIRHYLDSDGRELWALCEYGKHEIVMSDTLEELEVELARRIQTLMEYLVELHRHMR
mgnify:CR=1 FL=1